MADGSNALKKVLGWHRGGADLIANVFLMAMVRGVEKFRIDVSGLLIQANGRMRQVFTNTDVDAQDNTLTVAQIVAGLITHTSVTAGGTTTTDTAAAIIAGSGGIGALTADNQCIICYYVNDGNQTVTFVGGSNVTVSDVAQTLLTHEACTLVFRRASATTVVMYVVGG